MTDSEEEVISSNPKTVALFKSYDEVVLKDDEKTRELSYGNQIVREGIQYMVTVLYGKKDYHILVKHGLFKG